MVDRLALHRRRESGGGEPADESDTHTGATAGGRRPRVGAGERSGPPGRPSAMHSPWQLVRAWRRTRTLARAAEVGHAVDVRGRVIIAGPGRIRIGHRVVLDGRSAPIELRAGPGAEIVLGDDVLIEGGATLRATAAIHIGASCRV